MKKLKIASNYSHTPFSMSKRDKPHESEMSIVKCDLNIIPAVRKWRRIGMQRVRA